MTPRAEGATRRVRVAALVLLAGLATGPVGTHVYWTLGGTWGWVPRATYSATGVARCGRRRRAAAVRLRCWSSWRGSGCGQQEIVSDHVIRFFAWALAAVFLLETVAAFTWSRSESEWWRHGPVSLVLGLLALVVAGSGGAWQHPPATPDAGLALTP